MRHELMARARQARLMLSEWMKEAHEDLDLWARPAADDYSISYTEEWLEPRIRRYKQAFADWAELFYSMTDEEKQATPEARFGFYDVDYSNPQQRKSWAERHAELKALKRRKSNPSRHQQRIQFNFHTLTDLTGGELLGDMATSKSAEARDSRMTLVNRVLEYFTEVCETEGDYESVKAYPASNGDDSAVLLLHGGLHLDESIVERTLHDLTLDALWNLDNADNDDRKDNPAPSRFVLLDAGFSEGHHGAHERYTLICTEPQGSGSRAYYEFLGFGPGVSGHGELTAADFRDLKAEGFRSLGKRIKVETLPQQYRSLAQRFMTEREDNPSRADEVRLRLAHETVERIERLPAHLQDRAQLAASKRWVEKYGANRAENPSHSGLPLGSIAIGAALGAAAVHLIKKRGQ